MKKTLAALIIAAFSCIPAFADLQATNGSDTIVLHKEACTLPAMQAIVPTPDMRAQFYKGEAWVSKKHFDLCYIKLDDIVGLIFEDGDVGQLPITDFKEMGT